MNKKIKITLCAVLCASMLAGCADNSASGGSAVSSDSSSDTQTTSSVSESTDSSSDTSSETSSIDESKLTEEQIYDNMVERSLMDLTQPYPPARCIGNRHDAMPCCTPILPQNAVSVNNWIQVIQIFYIFAQKRACLRSRPSRLVIHR